MAANPALLQQEAGYSVPAPFPQEVIALSRGCIDISLDNLQTRSGKWSTRGTVYLTNLRLVFIANKADTASGLVAFDLPLPFIKADKFNQPIFGCNNLSGQCWPLAADGGPNGSHPPHNFVLYFKEGGVGTFLPLYFRFLQYHRALQSRPQSAAPANSRPAPSAPAMSLSQAFVDPNDPSQLFLASPVTQEQRLTEQPKYAADYGKAEAQYQDMSGDHS